MAMIESVNYYSSGRSAHLSVPEVQKENDKEQDRWERHHERDGTEPSEYKRAVAGVGGQGNSNDVMKSSEQFCEEFDHSCPR
jgi:hypothetical protein